MKPDDDMYLDPYDDDYEFTQNRGGGSIGCLLLLLILVAILYIFYRLA